MKTIITIIIAAIFFGCKSNERKSTVLKHVYLNVDTPLQLSKSKVQPDSIVWNNSGNDTAYKSLKMDSTALRNTVAYLADTSLVCCGGSGIWKADTTAIRITPDKSVRILRYNGYPKKVNYNGDSTGFHKEKHLVDGYVPYSSNPQNLSIITIDFESTEREAFDTGDSIIWLRTGWITDTAILRYIDSVLKHRCDELIMYGGDSPQYIPDSLLIHKGDRKARNLLLIDSCGFIKQ